MITIKNLHANVEGKKILNGINLEIKPGGSPCNNGPLTGQAKALLQMFLREMKLMKLPKERCHSMVKTC